MSDFAITLSWKRNSDSLVYGKYSTKHDIFYNEHYQVVGDADQVGVVIQIIPIQNKHWLPPSAVVI